MVLVVTLFGMVGFSRAGNAVRALQATAKATNEAVTEPPATVNAGVPARARVYYLTVKSFTGGDAITACDSEFHMASLSEIQDPSKLQYAPRGIPAYDPAQASNQFPDHTGWVRIGDYPLTEFRNNCNFWQSNSDQQSGTTMTRRSLTGENGRSLYNSDPAAWSQWIRTASCSQPEPVWCVEDPE